MDQMTDGGKLIELRRWLRARGANDGRDGAFALVWPVALFVFIAGTVAVDLAEDMKAGMGAVHMGVELVALALALGGVARTARQLRDALRRAHTLGRDLEGTRADLVRWRGEAEGLLAGLASTIDRQLEAWRLSTAEREVAWLVLKGLSYKEVAEVRETTERTVRHQAIAIYRKAGLAGRAEMAAFFLEDLLEPRATTRPGEAARPRRSGVGAARAEAEVTHIGG